MKKFFILPLIGAITLSASMAAAENTAITPAPRDGGWVKRHEGFVEQAKAGHCDLLFLGDSITDGWRTKGKEIWEKQYGSRHALNFGIGGDRTQHVLWRMDHGTLNGIKPKVVVLMIGTNNTGKEKDSGKERNSTAEIVGGVTAIVKGLHTQMPRCKILLLAVFPRGDKDNPVRGQLKEINTAIAKLDDGKAVKYLDIGAKFLEADGTLSKDIMPDLLHPNAKGYQIWADAIEPTLAKMLK